MSETLRVFPVGLLNEQADGRRCDRCGRELGIMWLALETELGVLRLNIACLYQEILERTTGTRVGGRTVLPADGAEQPSLHRILEEREVQQPDGWSDDLDAVSLAATPRAVPPLATAVLPPPVPSTDGSTEYLPEYRRALHPLTREEFVRPVSAHIYGWMPTKSEGYRRLWPEYGFDVHAIPRIGDRPAQHHVTMFIWNGQDWRYSAKVANSDDLSSYVRGGFASPTEAAEHCWEHYIDRVMRNVTPLAGQLGR